MTTRSSAARAIASQSVSFGQFAGVSGIITGVSSLLYAVFFGGDFDFPSSPLQLDGYVGDFVRQWFSCCSC